MCSSDLHAEYASLAQEPANHGYPDQLGFRHGADLMLEPEGEYQKKGIRSRRVVGADQHAALRDVLPAEDVYKRQQRACF